ncbi:helix-turn-helix transcriptional regulator [Inediibacterium massiliense]|uniref:helix-turn-helix transcriptional regulator n=1 Tax=Inediibacterium massiliense TaxID=1658111 RepID=UPI0006B405FB|nr:WYL domain-containing transcriptional regulator [Inediibacterium massiliense]
MGKINIYIQDKIHGLTFLMYEFLRGKKLSTKEMGEYIGKSQRTCQRYIEILRDCDVPIKSEKNKYYLDVEKEFIPIYLTKAKVNMLYISLMSFHAFGKEIEIVQALLKEIQSFISPKDEYILENIKNNLIVKRRYDVITKGDNANYYVFMLLVEAFSEKRTVLIKYKGKQEENYRRIDVYGFCLAKETYYVIAYCHLRNSIRQFRVDRIIECSIEDSIYTIPKQFDLKGYYEYAWEVENSCEPYEVQILFSKKVKEKIQEKIWHKTQQVEMTNDNKILFRATISSKEEIKQWILSFGCEAKVIKPKWLRNEIISQLEKSIKEYKNK